MSPILGIYASQISGHLTPPPSFYNIATATGNGTATNITFSSIPQTYKSLQLRIIAQDIISGTVVPQVNIWVNGNSSGIYANHTLEGDGSSAFASGATGNPLILSQYVPYALNANIYGVGIFDFIDYASTSKNKTARGIQGYNKNGSGNIQLSSGLYPSTTAITSITIGYAASGFSTSSTFALYGIN